MSDILSRQFLGQFTAYPTYLPFIIFIGNLVYIIWIVCLYPLYLYKQNQKTMKTYIKRTNKKTNEELYFMGFIPLGAFGEAEHWIPSIHLMKFNEASEIFIKLTTANDGKYRYQLLVKN